MPPHCLWIQFTPPGVRAAHAGQSGKWGGGYRASSDQQDVWTGQGSHQRGAGGTGSGALTVCQSCTTGMAAHTRGWSSMPPSSSATLWQRCQSGGEGCILTTWNQVKTNSQGFCLSASGHAWSSRVWTATEHKKSLCSHLALDLASVSTSHRAASCQYTLGKPRPWPTLLQLCPKASKHTDCTGTCPHKDTPARLVQVTSFIQLEEVKQIEKTEKFVSS